MKRLFTTLFFFALIAAGIYYLYATNDNFKKYVNVFIQSNDQDTDSVSTSSTEFTETKEKKSSKKKSDYADEIALIDGDSWNYFIKDNNTFTISHKPINNPLEICVKINWFDKNFSTIAEYKVTKEGSVTSSNK